ncbi:MAG: hypothetical protein ACFBZ8_06820 [Opitutales bacterium]
MRKAMTTIGVPLLLAAGLLVAVTGCETTEGNTAAAPAPTPAPSSNNLGQTLVLSQGADASNRNYTWKGFPPSARTPQEAEILVEKSVPREVKPREIYSYEMAVVNRSGYSLDDISLTEALPADFKLESATPKPEIRQNSLRWNLGTMAPGQKEIITITGSASRAGSLKHGGNTDLNFSLGEMVAIVAVVEPNLEFKLTGPTNAVINDLIPIQLTVRNAGSAPVRKAKIVHTLPKGLLTKEGKSNIEIPVGDLQPGASRAYDLSLRGIEIGDYQTKFIVTALDNLSAQATYRTSVQRPQLVISADAPSRRFVGNIITYDITLKNTGNAPARNTVIEQALSEGTSLVSANEGGNSVNNAVVWNVGTLQPGETKRVQAKAVAKQILTARSVAKARAVAADNVDAVMTTDIEGIAAILLEVGDLNDPVPVGETETYEIKATNQGSKTATRLVVRCILEDGMEFVKSTGATKANLEGNSIVFEPLPALDAQSEAVWRVIVKATKANNVRFTASIESEQLDRPVTENEATHFYE